MQIQTQKRKINLRIVVLAALIFSLLINLKDIKQGIIDGMNGRPSFIVK